MRHIVGMILDGGEFPSATISVSERILNRTLMDSIRQAELTVIDDKLRNIDTFIPITNKEWEELKAQGLN